MERQIVLNDFTQTFSDLENVISLFKSENFNEVPFNDSWTPAQVVQHLILANENFAAILNGSTKETTRAIDEQLSRLKSLFLNFELKMKSPVFILPAIGPYDQQQQVEIISNIKNDCLNAITALDLSRTCLDFELPSFELLTRLEAIYFVIYHTQRHTRQLKEIAKFLKLY
ncbi:DinB family protein [Pedobacter insulae]|uniref:DinB superfamily protein n=1 Tax=Pedobacter insulae TaxID=414048 RepID=A0A1I3A7C3_9SPHI|nr:DinB family protein [Pedobacter insulae]SFH45997.1 DinB superfamily protein [Pedobacter insulae]